MLIWVLECNKSCRNPANSPSIMRREEEPRRENNEYLEDLLACIPFIRELLQSLVDEQREEKIWEEEWSMHKEQYEAEPQNADFDGDFIDEWG